MSAFIGLMFPCMRPIEKHYTRRMVFLLRPSDAEFDTCLEQLANRFCKRGVADILGVSILTLQGWFSRRNRPSAAARKAIWLVWSWAFEPESVQNLFDIITWGRFRRSQAAAPKTPSPLASQSLSAGLDISNTKR